MQKCKPCASNALASSMTWHGSCKTRQWDAKQPPRRSMVIKHRPRNVNVVKRKKMLLVEPRRTASTKRTNKTNETRNGSESESEIEKRESEKENAMIKEIKNDE